MTPRGFIPGCIWAHWLKSQEEKRFGSFGRLFRLPFLLECSVRSEMSGKAIPTSVSMCAEPFRKGAGMLGHRVLVMPVALEKRAGALGSARSASLCYHFSNIFKNWT